MKSLTNYLCVAMLALAIVPVPTPTATVSGTPSRYKLVPLPEPAAVRHRHLAPQFRNLHGVSGNWGGYAVESNVSKTQNGSVTDVQGTWNVPAVLPSESDNTYSAVWVGIDGFNSNTVEQIGTEQDVTPTGPIYYAWLQLYPHGAFLIQNFPVAPGDTVTASVHYIGSNQYQLSIANVTQNQTFTTAEPLTLKNAKRRSAEWIVEAPYSGGILPLADFESVSFSSCATTLNGVAGPIGSPVWHNESIDMAVSNTLKAKTSSLNGLDSFSVTWNHE